MSRNRRFIQCDVFTSMPTRGNALAVVVDGDELSEESMRAFARWTNLAETTFLQTPTEATADYKVRILTPSREMPFAGHPTLGSCAAWLHHGGVPKQPGVVRQECGVGIVEIDISGEVPAFIAPPTKIEAMPESDFDSICAELKLDKSTIVRSAVLDNGPVWQVFELSSAQAVLQADSSLLRWPEVRPVGLIGPHPAGSECDYEVRMLAPSSGMSEDPITGSLNSALAHWMQSLALLPRSIVVAQGTKIDRAGRVYIDPDPNVAGRVRIGGHTHILVEGVVQL